MNKLDACIDYLMKTASDYEIYHDTYSSAISEVKKAVKKKGFELDEDDVFHNITTGPRKPSKGKSLRFTLLLYKNGEPAKKSLHFQIENLGSSYELNLYFDSASLRDYQ